VFARCSAEAIFGASDIRVQRSEPQMNNTQPDIFSAAASTKETSLV